MPPKKAPGFVGEVDEIKVTLDFLTTQITDVKEQQTRILDLVKEVQVLRKQNEEKDRRIAQLESRVSDLEQYTRMNDIIISGLPIRPRTYARAVDTSSGDGATELDTSSTEQQVAAFLRSKGIDLNCDNVEACHVLPRRNAGEKPPVILRFVNRKHKIAILKEGRKLKGTNVYINEHLTKHNAEIAKKARYLRKMKKIQNTWTANCKVFIKLNGSPEEAKVMMVRSMEELEKFQ